MREKIDLKLLLLFILNGILLLCSFTMELTHIGLYIQVALSLLTFAILLHYQTAVHTLLWFVTPLLVVALIKPAVHLLHDIESEEFYFCKPHSKKVLVINENAFLFGSDIELYRLRYFIFKEDIPNICISTDDGYRPFHSDEFSIEWEDDTVTIRYNYGNLQVGWSGVQFRF